MTWSETTLKILETLKDDDSVASDVRNLNLLRSFRS
jgi:hypothetical protein